MKRPEMDEVMIRDAAGVLDESMAPEIRLSREEALLAQGFAESVADLLTAELSKG